MVDIAARKQPLIQIALQFPGQLRIGQAKRCGHVGQFHNLAGTDDVAEADFFRILQSQTAGNHQKTAAGYHHQRRKAKHNRNILNGTAAKDSAEP
ncbi:hypothetical protein SDC9_181908 [bioreactor metagenome]|uniref:Uncharacterized protein n=1 Tax=bioreactor metagenome TaxID=1076179 RepID=A0A645H5Z9_9ZZZZ